MLVVNAIQPLLLVGPEWHQFLWAPAALNLFSFFLAVFLIMGIPDFDGLRRVDSPALLVRSTTSFASETTIFAGEAIILLVKPSFSVLNHHFRYWNHHFR